MNNKKYKILIITLTIIASTIITFIRDQYDIFSIIGGSIAIILGPYIIASLIRYGLKLSLWNFNFDDKSFLRTFIVIWCIQILLNIIGAAS
jgi:cytochrome c biogenesis protein CcdA